MGLVHVVNALSEWCSVEVWQKGKVFAQCFERGITKSVEVI